ncbi:DUF4395 domain-containing protein [Guyparkeria sp. 1SP6A2]|nr:DUF4395 domain-containing protein [Guyparkeria sp. 1SP6A2]
MFDLKRIFHFGEVVDDYPVRVINEREARAAAGFLALFAGLAFAQGFLTGNFMWERLLILAFTVEFGIRVLVNPQFAPFMILGRLITRNQEVEYVGAPQKRIAWGIGLGIALFMIWVVFIQANTGLLNLIGCSACLLFLVFEAAFGICLGCVAYNLVTGQKPQLCPGGACSIKRIEPIQRVRPWQAIFVVLFLVGLWSVPTFNLWNIQNNVEITDRNFDSIDLDSLAY